MRAWIFALGLMVSVAGASPARLKPFTYPPQKISVRGITQIKIVGMKGNLRLIGGKSTHALTLKVSQALGRKFDDWHLSVERRGHTLVFDVFSDSYGRTWRSQLRKDQWPEFDIELVGTARPAVIGWREGDMKFIGWNAEVEASIMKGAITVRGGRGRLNLRPVESQLSIQSHVGETLIQGEKGGIQISNSSGDLKLNWLKGDISLLQCRGDLSVESQAGELKVRGGSGQLKLRWQEGSAQVSGFHGLVDAKGGATVWHVAASAPADINVTSLSGSVGVDWMGGVKAFLTSNHGLIRYPRPAFLRAQENDGIQVVSGVHRGVRAAKAMGQVFVRTETGAITWKSLTD